MTDSPLPAVPQADVSEAVSRARDALRSSRESLAEATGGASSSRVLGELAHELANELAQQFDELPMHRFIGRVRRAEGMRGLLLLPRRIPHRVVLARYVTATVPSDVGGGLTQRYATIAVVGIGADGELRCGTTKEFVNLQKVHDVGMEPLDWDDIRIRNVPGNSLSMRRWNGGPEPVQVASPARLIVALTAIATAVAAQASNDLALLKRLL